MKMKKPSAALCWERKRTFIARYQPGGREVEGHHSGESAWDCSTWSEGGSGGGKSSTWPGGAGERRCRDSELQLKTFHDELTMLRNRGPQIEYKETIKEVIKYKIDPETERELEKLRNEIVDKTHQTEKFEMEILQLKEEIQRWKDTMPQIHTKEVVNEILQYREDPKTKEEIESLKRKLAEEQRKRLDLENERGTNEERIRIKKIDLSQVRETFVQQEVVKMEQDPLLRSDCDTFTQTSTMSRNRERSWKKSWSGCSIKRLNWTFSLRSWNVNAEPAEKRSLKSRGWECGSMNWRSGTGKTEKRLQ